MGRKGVEEAKQRRNWGPTGAATSPEAPKAGKTTPPQGGKPLSSGERYRGRNRASDVRTQRRRSSPPPHPFPRHAPIPRRPLSLPRPSSPGALLRFGGPPQLPSPPTRAFGPKPALTSTQPAGRSPIMENPIRWGAGQKLVDEPHSYKASRYGSYEVRSLIENSLAGGGFDAERGRTPPERPRESRAAILRNCNPVPSPQAGSVPATPAQYCKIALPQLPYQFCAWAGRHQPISQAMEGSSRWPTSSSP